MKTTIKNPGFRLIGEISHVSKASGWDVVRAEWKIVDTDKPDVPSECLCGQSIKRFFVVENHETAAIAKVGSCCVETLTGKTPETTFASARRRLKYGYESLYVDVIETTYDFGWISKCDHKFYMDILKTPWQTY